VIGAVVRIAMPAMPAETPVAQARLDRSSATVGERIGLSVNLDLPNGFDYEPVGLGPDLGPFRVSDGKWVRATSPAEEKSLTQWRWNGEIAAFETGELTVPAVRMRVRGPAGESTVGTDPIEITIESVLPAGEDPARLEIADLKKPASVAADFRALRIALLALSGLLLLSGVLWWLARRFGPSLARAPEPPDPFERLEPHEWAFRELQRLLAQRLHEDGRVDAFHSELAGIVKRYLGGRFRVDLMERTTSEVRESLDQAGVSGSTIDEAERLLAQCDAVKFAGVRPDASACRERVEEAYRLVDATRPAKSAVETDEGAA
jgi:hypothetical protein